MFTRFKIFTLLFLLTIFLWPIPSQANLSQRLAGRILLQVEANGEAWYVNPVDAKRYYLGRPADAFYLMQTLGLGISETDWQSFSRLGASRLAGRILLRVHDKGQAYYVNPLDNRLYYLDRPATAFNLMRQFGLGITTANLNQIVSASANLPNSPAPNPNPNDQTHTHYFTWRYGQKDYYLKANLSENIYNLYNQDPKVYTYPANNPPTDLRNSYYGIFLQTKPEDQQSLEVLEALQDLAKSQGLNQEETLEFILAFIQYIPYDNAKAQQANPIPYFPFETLYLQKGVCADKTFLAVFWLRALNYGAAILDFPDSNHSALGILCPQADSLNNSSYCFLETTNYFPPGVVPQTLNNGLANPTDSSLNNVFSSNNLGTMEIKQTSSGQTYYGVTRSKERVSSLQAENLRINNLKQSLDQEKTEIDQLYTNLEQIRSSMLAARDSGDLATYNSLVPQYNNLVKEYDDKAKVYQVKINEYNQAVNSFNQAWRDFYQIVS